MDTFGFGRKLVPSRIFESYTPTELSLKQTTVDDKGWTTGVIQVVETQMRCQLTGQRLDVYFRQYINANFPLQTANPEDFRQYVLREETKAVGAAAPPPPPTHQQWWTSDPRGQRYTHYSVVSREEHFDDCGTTFELFRGAPANSRLLKKTNLT